MGRRPTLIIPFYIFIAWHPPIAFGNFEAYQLLLIIYLILTLRVSNLAKIAEEQLFEKKVVLITHSFFWRKGAGFWSRTRELLRFLGRHTDLSVFFLGVCSDQEKALINQDYSFLTFINLNQKKETSTTDLVDMYKEYIRQNGTADVYIIDKTENSYMLWALSDSGRKFVDTHDLISQRTRSARQYNAYSGIEISEEKEKALLHFYDSVICIQEDDCKLVAEWLGKNKVILASHPVYSIQHLIRENVRKIGFIASKWVANVDGLKWFLEKVWPGVNRNGLSLSVYGRVCESFDNFAAPGVALPYSEPGYMLRSC